MAGMARTGRAVEHRLGGSAYPAGRDDVADMARTLSGGETPLELITRLGWITFVVASVQATRLP